MISKTCKEASKNIPARGGAPKEEYMFVNAEEEFFCEVMSNNWSYLKTVLYALFWGICLATLIAFNYVCLLITCLKVLNMYMFMPKQKL